MKEAEEICKHCMYNCGFIRDENSIACGAEFKIKKLDFDICAAQETTDHQSQKVYSNFDTTRDQAEKLFRIKS